MLKILGNCVEIYVEASSSRLSKRAGKTTTQPIKNCSHFESGTDLAYARIVPTKNALKKKHSSKYVQMPLYM